MDGKEFAKARKALGLSQSKLALRLGYKVVTISCKENDRRRVTKRDELALRQIASDVTAGINNPPPPTPNPDSKKKSSNPNSAKQKKKVK